jgi:hypothetical protein
MILPVIFGLAEFQKNSWFMFVVLMDVSNLTNNAQGKIGRQVEHPYTHFKRRDTCIVNGIEPIHR